MQKRVNNKCTLLLHRHLYALTSCIALIPKLNDHCYFVTDRFLYLLHIDF